jgi:co-chaperonin GroES (HSP10)
MAQRDRVLLKRVEVEERTPAGIIVPDTAKEKPVEGGLGRRFGRAG